MSPGTSSRASTTCRRPSRSDRRLRREVAPERIHRPLGLTLLDEGDDGVQQNDGRDGHRQGERPAQRRQPRREPEEQRERVHELAGDLSGQVAPSWRTSSFTPCAARRRAASRDERPSGPDRRSRNSRSSGSSGSSCGRAVGVSSVIGSGWSQPSLPRGVEDRCGETEGARGGGRMAVTVERPGWWPPLNEHGGFAVWPFRSAPPGLQSRIRPDRALRMAREEYLAPLQLPSPPHRAGVVRAGRGAGLGPPPPCGGLDAEPARDLITLS